MAGLRYDGWVDQMLLPSARIACVGDLMIEHLVPTARLPKMNTTLVFDELDGSVGGNAFNLCWDFVKLGQSATFHAIYGKGQDRLIKNALKNGAIVGHLIEGPGGSDTLIAFTSDHGAQAIYLRAAVDGAAAIRLIRSAYQSEVVVFCGSRHAIIRQHFIEHANLVSGLLVFAPSYSITTYSLEELRAMSTAAGLIVVNASEAKKLIKALGFSSVAAAARSATDKLFIVTDASRGATLYNAEIERMIPSQSGRSGDVIGAGDAFLAGFLTSWIRRDDLDSAADCAAFVAATLVRDGGVRLPSPLLLDASA